MCIAKVKDTTIDPFHEDNEYFWIIFNELYRALGCFDKVAVEHLIEDRSNRAENLLMDDEMLLGRTNEEVDNLSAEIAVKITVNVS
jgi:hypothetical protein